MTDVGSAEAEDVDASTITDDDGSMRERSTIKFPYADLNESVKMAAALKNNFGSHCDTDQLAAAINQRPTSSAFRIKLAAAAIFGVIVNSRGKIQLTELGNRVADEHTRTDALPDAFLHVELYRAVFEKFKGLALPGGPGLESELRGLGVASKQAERARQILQRSAQQAGLTWAASDRLVLPPKASDRAIPQEDSSPDKPVEQDQPAARDQRTWSTPQSAILEGLWAMLPTEGSFPREDRDLWFTALRAALDLVYGPSASPSAASSGQGQSPSN